ncbi:MAG: pilin [Patescibacteria group bacterium]
MPWTDCLSPEGVATLNCIPIVFSNIVNWALILSGTTALFFVIISGTRYIRSGGDQEKIKGARETLTYAIIGLVIILLSFGIINFISYVTNVECIKQFGFGNCT